MSSLNGRYLHLLNNPAVTREKTLWLPLVTYPQVFDERFPKRKRKKKESLIKGFNRPPFFVICSWGGLLLRDGNRVVVVFSSLFLSWTTTTAGRLPSTASRKEKRRSAVNRLIVFGNWPTGVSSPKKSTAGCQRL